MNDDEQVFDFMAAAEETGRQVDLLVRQVPGHIKTTLATAMADEWRKVTVFKELTEATGKLNDTIVEARKMVTLLRQTIRVAITVGVIVAVVIPIIGWVIANK